MVHLGILMCCFRSTVLSRPSFLSKHSFSRPSSDTSLWQDELTALFLKVVTKCGQPVRFLIRLLFQAGFLRVLPVVWLFLTVCFIMKLFPIENFLVILI
ncbi:hypothetical protein RO3G_11440 [Rhizopus delemar RA 99-880]|uniref:Uncharacterized protein n=1 Tax=Rhizopus delemar (strain RA 99-880 / ATCC MYA-4621 / FGSC 9543 / NRRL 43880) TaxID=246409 RepID=I1CE49_RHIO9|nr:hypothetical protein RO3G_11440 [Rhizopus delemar RA 99-880]|eukprot:EIE86729.1 hypothetical protein RO3G_11440 [Rhizopus delemar RA 99-880]